MRSIVRITSSYDEHEDRQRFAVLDSEDAPLCLWLTRRLAWRLVTALLTWVGGGPDDPEALQAWRQEVAEAAREEAAPVWAGGGQEQFLVTTIDLNHDSENCRIVFRWSEGRGAGIVFGSMELRQWLGILHGLYRQAEWLDPIWPEWFTAKDLAETVLQ